MGNVFIIVISHVIKVKFWKLEGLLQVVGLVFFTEGWV